jgi:TM2 domain-containing membrane protein YozV
MNRLAAILITFFLGVLGVHRFMAGKIGTGIIWLLTAGCLGIGWLVDFIMVCLGTFKKKDGSAWTIN